MKKTALLLVTAFSLVAIMVACKEKHAAPPAEAQVRSYDVDQDPNDPQHTVAPQLSAGPGQAGFQ